MPRNRSPRRASTRRSSGSPPRVSMAAYVVRYPVDAGNRRATSRSGSFRSHPTAPEARPAPHARNSAASTTASAAFPCPAAMTLLSASPARSGDARRSAALQPLVVVQLRDGAVADGLAVVLVHRPDREIRRDDGRDRGRDQLVVPR